MEELSLDDAEVSVGGCQALAPDLVREATWRNKREVT